MKKLVLFLVIFSFISCKKEDTKFESVEHQIIIKSLKVKDGEKVGEFYIYADVTFEWVAPDRLRTRLSPTKVCFPEMDIPDYECPKITTINGEICCVGKMDNIKGVKETPQTGYNKEINYIDGNGYVIRYTFELLGTHYIVHSGMYVNDEIYFYPTFKTDDYIKIKFE